MIIEHRVVRLAPGVDEAAAVAADEAVQQRWAPFQPGFVRRTTARDVDDPGRWLVETLWSELEDAVAAERAAEADEACIALRGLLDPTQDQVTRWRCLDG